MSCYLGIDYGSKRIGLAVSDPSGRFASPLKTILATGNDQFDAAAILDAAKEFDVTAIVIGLPLNMDDSMGTQARATQRFGEMLRRVSTLPIHYWDERLSTLAADELLSTANLSRRKKRDRRDRVAAQQILHGFLEAQAGSPNQQE